MPAEFFRSNATNTSRIIHTPSHFAKQSLLYLQEIGTLQAVSSHLSGRVQLESFLFFVVRSGAGTLHYEGESYDLQAGDCVFIDCRKQYSHISNPDNLWKLSWIHFYGPTISDIYEKYRERGGLPAFHSQSYPQYDVTYQTLYNIASGSSYVRDMEINTELASLLTTLMQDAWQTENADNRGKKSDLLSLKTYLDANFTEKITLDDLAQRYYINKFYLTRIFKEQFGTSINNYLLDLRITRAKSLLRFSDLTADAIGLECGIGSGYYFSRVFKQVEGISPSEYRKRWRTG